MATSRRSRSTAKSLKRITTSGLEGTWDTKRCCISLDLPVGVTSIKMIVEGVDGVHTMDFSSFECSASFIWWKDYDYPWSSSDFLLAREAWQQGTHPPVAFSHPYPRHQDIVRFENPTRPTLPLRWPMTMARSLILPFRAPLCAKLCHAMTSLLPVPLSHRPLLETDACHGDSDSPVLEPHPILLGLPLCFVLSPSPVP